MIDANVLADVQLERIHSSCVCFNLLSSRVVFPHPEWPNTTICFPGVLIALTSWLVTADLSTNVTDAGDEGV